jgi:hypothetical protein
LLFDGVQISMFQFKVFSISEGSKKLHPQSYKRKFAEVMGRNHAPRAITHVEKAPRILPASQNDNIRYNPDRPNAIGGCS